MREAGEWVFPNQDVTYSTFVSLPSMPKAANDTKSVVHILSENSPVF